MRTPKPLPEEAVSLLPLEMKQAKTKAEFQRLQCVWLRALVGLSSKQVATAVGWHPCSVRRVQSQYLKAGEASLKREGRGGRDCKLVLARYSIGGDLRWKSIDNRNRAQLA